MLDVTTTVHEDTYLFRSESELQQEEKGGYLSGVFKLEGINSSTEKVIKIELFLESGHSSKLHCNLFRISGKHCLYRENGRKTNKEQQNMSAAAYKINIVRRNSDNKLVLDTKHHQNYLLSAIKDISFCDDDGQSLKLGGNDGLLIKIVKPLSKQDNVAKSGKNRAHIRDVLKLRKEDELNEELRNIFPESTRQQEVSRQLEIFCKEQLGPQAKKQKLACKNLESFLSETENIHKCKLKIVYWISSMECNNNSTMTIRKVEGLSEWILASNLYTMEIDQKRTRSHVQVLVNAPIQLLTVMLSKCEATLALKFQAEFLWQEKVNNINTEANVDNKEIKITNIKKPDKSENEHSVLRIGGSKTHTLQFTIQLVFFILY